MMFWRATLLSLLSVSHLPGCVESQDDPPHENVPLSRKVSYERVDSNGRLIVDVSRMVNDLKNNDWRIRQRAADGVPWKSDADYGEVVPLLFDCLKSPHESLQLSALTAIDHISRQCPHLPSLSYPALVTIIKSAAAVENRRRAIIALGNIAHGTGHEEAMIALMTEQLRNPRDQIFRQAADVLGDCKSRAIAAVPELVRQLGRNRFRATLASKALGQIGGDPAVVVPALVSALQQPDAPEQRIAATLAVFGTDAAPAVSALIPLLSRGDGNIVNAAALALGNMGTQAENATDALGTAFQKAGHRMEVQMHITSALCSIGPVGRAVLASQLSDSTAFQVYDAGFRPLVYTKLLQSLADIGSLTQLDLAGVTFSAEDVRPLSQMVNLREVIMPKKSGDEHLQSIASLTLLRRLKVGDHVTDAGMSNLSNLTALTSLHAVGILGEGLKHVQHAESLEELQMDNAGDQAFRHLRPFEQLQTLTVRSRNVTNAAIVHLRDLSNLKILDLSHSAVNDDGVRVLANHLPQLERLDLHHCPITAGCVNDLGRLTHLKHLGVYATSLAGNRHVLNMSQTPAVQRLIRELPNCSVTYAD